MAKPSLLQSVLNRPTQSYLAPETVCYSRAIYVLACTISLPRSTPSLLPLLLQRTFSLYIQTKMMTNQTYSTLPILHPGLLLNFI